MSAQTTLSDLIQAQSPELFDGSGGDVLSANFSEQTTSSPTQFFGNPYLAGTSDILLMTDGEGGGLTVDGFGPLDFLLEGVTNAPSGTSGSLLMTDGFGDSVVVSGFSLSNIFLGGTGQNNADSAITALSGGNLDSLFNGSGGSVVDAQNAVNAANAFQVLTASPNLNTITLDNTTWSSGDAILQVIDRDGTVALSSGETSGLVAFQPDGGLATAIESDLAPYLAAGKLVTNAAPTTGQTVNAAGVRQDELIYIQPAGTLLALTIQLEPGGGVVADIGDIKEIFISQIITGLTVSTTGGTVRGTALTTSSAVNGSYEYIKVTSTDWLRIR